MTVTLMIGIDGSGIDIVSKHMLEDNKQLRFLRETDLSQLVSSKQDAIVEINNKSYVDIDNLLQFLYDDKVRIVFFIDSLNLEYCKEQSVSKDEKLLAKQQTAFKKLWNKQAFFKLNKNIENVTNWSAGLIM